MVEIKRLVGLYKNRNLIGSKAVSIAISDCMFFSDVSSNITSFNLRKINDGQCILFLSHRMSGSISVSLGFV